MARRGSNESDHDAHVVMIVDRRGNGVGFDGKGEESFAETGPERRALLIRSRGDLPLQDQSNNNLKLLQQTSLLGSTSSSINDDDTHETCEDTSSLSHSHSSDEEMSPAPGFPSAGVKVENGPSSGMPSWLADLVWLAICFAGIMASFVAYGILLEYATTGDRSLHELSFLFVTSVLAAITAWIGRAYRGEALTDIPANRFLVLGLMSLGSTFCAIRALRYVIFPIQVLARSCKPVPVMIIGAFLGKKYPRRKYLSVFLIVCGVALFMGGGNILKSSGDSSDSVDDGASSDGATIDGSIDGNSGDQSDEDDSTFHQQLLGVLLLVTSLFFDGGTGAYEDKLMSMHSVEPFDLMLRFQLSKALLSGMALIVFGQVHLFVTMIHQTGIYILALGMCSAIGQVFIFITIAKFGALTCSLMSLTRKVTTLTASFIIYGHELSVVQFVGLVVALGAMLLNFVRPKEDESVFSKEDVTKKLRPPSSKGGEPEYTLVVPTGDDLVLAEEKLGAVS